MDVVGDLLRILIEVLPYMGFMLFIMSPLIAAAIMIMYYRGKITVHILDKVGDGYKEIKSMKISISQNKFEFNKSDYIINLDDSITMKFMVFMQMTHLLYIKDQTLPIKMKAESKSGEKLRILTGNKVLGQLFGTDTNTELLLYVCIGCCVLSLIAVGYLAYQTNNMQQTLATILSKVSPQVIK